MKGIFWAIAGGILMGLVVVTLSDVSFTMPPVLGWDHVGDTCLDEIFNTVVFLAIVSFSFVHLIGGRSNDRS